MTEGPVSLSHEHLPAYRPPRASIVMRRGAAVYPVGLSRNEWRVAHASNIRSTGLRTADGPPFLDHADTGSRDDGRGPSLGRRANTRRPLSWGTVPPPPPLSFRAPGLSPA